ncbi:MAG: hypothetical protein QW081_00595 [Desulfurococcaceae archaeon]
MKYLGLIAVAVVAIGLMVPLVVAAEEEPPRMLPELVTVKGGWARFKPIVLNYTVAVELAYVIRNLTYDLYEWEVSYNVRAAEVLLGKADNFLSRALELGETAPRRAAVFAFLAAVHYSHAPALANPVLGRVIDENLGENYTVTEQTVEAVVKVSGELREILVNAIEKAEEYGVNTTLAEKLLALGDARIENATQLLTEGDVELAFRYAVSGYRAYVRAYNTLVRTVFTKYIREAEAGLVRGLVEQVKPPARTLLPHLPVRIREMVRERVEAGQLVNISEVVREVREHAERVREQVRSMEKENLKMVIRERIEKTVEAPVLREELKKLVDETVEKAFMEGHRGVELARRVLEQLREKLAERIGERSEQVVRIPAFPEKPRAPVTPPITLPITPPR